MTSDVFVTSTSLTPSSISVTTVTLTPTSSVAFSDLGVDAWRQVRDYVVEQVISYHGRFPRNAAKEAGIFKGFVTRWGDNAMPIARVAFETHRGIWHNAPIRVERFSQNSDPYFASVIAQTL